MTNLDTSFADGDVISIDPRNEDPLIYYLFGGAWDRPVSLALDPPYEARTVASVSSRIHDDHLTTCEALDDEKLRQVVERFVTTLSKIFAHWTYWNAEFPSWLIERVGRDCVEQYFRAAGWHESRVPGHAVLRWSRRRGPDA